MTYLSPPLVSVLMPAYNASAFIGLAIASVQAQTFTQWELIIANDGSTDDTLAIATRYAQQDERIKVLNHTTNSGSFAAMRNAALAQAKGQYIANLDSDDEYEPTALQTLVAYLEANPGCIMACGYYGNIDEASKPCPNQLSGVVWHNGHFNIDTSKIDPHNSFKVMHDKTWPNILKGLIDNHVQGMLFRHGALRQLGGWDPSLGYYADVALTYQAYQTYFDAITILPEIIFKYRQFNSQNLSGNKHSYIKRVNELLHLLSWFFTQPVVPAAALKARQEAYNFNVCLLAYTAKMNGHHAAFFQVLGQLFRIPQRSLTNACMVFCKTAARAYLL
jgi:glycosyltransferase involved in cell wall biosynthesis